MALCIDALLQALYGWPPYTPLYPSQRYNAVLTALALPITVHALNPLVTTLLPSYMSICAQFSILLTLLPSIFIRHIRFEAIQMAREVARVSDGEKRDSCSTCQDLAFRDESWTPFRMPPGHRNIWEANASYESLRLSSREGCPSCDLLFQFSKIVLKDIPDLRPELVTSKYKWWWQDSKLDIEMEYGDTTLKRAFPMYVTTGQSRCTKSYIYTRYIARTHLSFSQKSNILQETIHLGNSYTLHGIYPSTVLPQSVFRS